jgi:hypothetical protein
MTPEEKEFLLSCEFGIAVEVDGVLEEVVLIPHLPTSCDYKAILLEAKMGYTGDITLREAMDFEVDIIKKDLIGDYE